MSRKLYCTAGSPPCRATMLTIKALGIKVEYQEVNLATGEQLKPEFLELNPIHTIPTLKDRDFVVWDSHVINAYLVEKYGKNDSLYSKDLQKRVIINQRLYFDDGVLFPRFANAARPLILGQEKTISKEKVDQLVEAYNFLETLLGKSTYVAGEKLTIADFSIISSLTSANLMVPTTPYPKITAWIKKMEALPYYAEANQKGVDALAALFKNPLA